MDTAGCWFNKKFFKPTKGSTEHEIRKCKNLIIEYLPLAFLGKLMRSFSRTSTFNDHSLKFYYIFLSEKVRRKTGCYVHTICRHAAPPRKLILSKGDFERREIPFL